MKRFYKIFQIWGSVVSMLVIMLVLSAATYAWFSANRIVSTDRASARSGTDSLQLQISETGGSDFRGSDETAIVQINTATQTQLMPVSTADLKTFVYNPASVDDMATNFRTVENEKYYYHGRIYLRATAEGKDAGARMALYLDEDNEVGGALAQANDGLLLNAARLGMTFDGGNPVIFSLSDTHNDVQEQRKNTVLNGVLLEDNQVLSASGGNVTAVADPSISIDSRKIIMNDSAVTLPAEPLLYMELNQIYMVDIYFYIEGCDTDCSDSISYDEADLHLAFYGILEE